MPKQHLNYKFVDTAVCTDGNRIDFWDKGKKGLLFRVTSTGSKTFAFRYRYNGKNKYYTIGPYPEISLGDARAKVDELKTQIRKGEDPIYEEKIIRRDTQSQTVQELAEIFLDIHVSQLKASTQKSYTHRINKIILPEFGQYKLKDLDRLHIIEFLEEMVFNEGQHVNANRVRAIFSSMISFAVDRGLIDFNVFKLVRKVGKENARRRIYEADEIKALWAAFNDLREPVSSLFKFMMLTGQRKTETAEMKWQHIKGDVWKLPAASTKAGRDHFVPLQPMARGLVEKLRPLTGSSEWVFESFYHPGNPLRWVHGSVNTVQDLSGVEDFRLHDLRRTVATNMTTYLGVDRTVLGKLLNHKTLAGDDTVTAVYDQNNYARERANALALWERRLQDIITGESDNIIQMGR